MTLVPEGRVWNYGIGLTQMWSPSLPYAITLDTPLPFWAEAHRPAAFLSVSTAFANIVYDPNTSTNTHPINYLFNSSPTWKEARMLQMWRIRLLEVVVVDLRWVCDVFALICVLLMPFTRLVHVLHNIIFLSFPDSSKFEGVGAI